MTKAKYVNKVLISYISKCTFVQESKYCPQPAKEQDHHHHHQQQQQSY
jgi:hypothetical protein